VGSVISENASYVKSTTYKRVSRENSFFAIFDKLVQEGGSNKGRRESAIILRIEPPVGEPVVKYLMT